MNSKRLDIISRFNNKIEELYDILPKKYYTPEFLDKNCAAWTILCIKEILGIEDQYFQNMASPLACVSGACGAVAAGLMSVGIIEGGGKEQQPLDQFKASAAGMKFINKFKRRFGSIACQELINLDLTKQEGMNEYIKEKIWEKQCYKHVIGALEIIRDTFKRRLMSLEKEGKL
ncbi:MAG: C_GCAxxG_C_C family protein [Promethearchaeota archaeon]|nr:MAG: C_GCAxxG_C_C family protein [Candidatus Lokiarchaeota archaeon]